ncbi:hypothetical protein E2C01_074156 [Portunus trituberculatus]|uniref:Uncharacterized protein n=1 Tax=Portunus trituberculatus TaxID=210409 RepID=A0A5B7I502_PORTR|nr:hypothetical protein [Portunus trituberculatus]
MIGGDRRCEERLKARKDELSCVKEALGRRGRILAAAALRRQKWEVHYLSRFERAMGRNCIWEDMSWNSPRTT